LERARIEKKKNRKRNQENKQVPTRRYRGKQPLENLSRKEVKVSRAWKEEKGSAKEKRKDIKAVFIRRNRFEARVGGGGGRKRILGDQSSIKGTAERKKTARQEDKDCPYGVESWKGGCGKIVRERKRERV